MQARRVLIRLLRASAGQEALGAMMDEVVQEVDSLSGRLMLIHMVGYRENVGSQLIPESKAESLERKVVQDLEIATASELSKEWDLARLVGRALAYLDEEEKTNLVGRLREHLGDDAFVLRLLKSSVNVAFLNYVPDRRLFWDELVAHFGDEFPEAVSRTIVASKELHLDTEDRETLELAQKYLDGWRPKGDDDL